MQPNVPINVDDDFSKVISKISSIQSQDIILVVPKDALLFSDAVNLKLLKKQTDILGKRISVLTMDPDGRKFAEEAGYIVQNFASMQKRSLGDFAARRPQPIRTQPQVVPPRPPVQPIPESPQIFQEVSYEHHTVQQSSGFFEKENAKIDLAKFQPDVVSEQSKSSGRSGRFTNKIILGIFFLALAIVFLLTAVILPQADITIYSKTNPLLRDMQITVDANTQQPNSDQLVIPGTKVSEAQKFTQSFQSTGINDSGAKATGSVTIYNFTGHILKLGAATTTLSAGSNVYRLVSDATNIKPTKYFANGTDIDKSSLSPAVAIVADQPGESYNLPQGTRLEIHNNVLGTIPQQLYARNDSQAIAGGTSVQNQIVSTSDLSKAQSLLPSDLLAAAEQQLQSSKGLTLLDTGSKLQNVNVVFDHKVNDPVASFSGTITANLSGLAYNQDQLKKLIEDRITLTLDKSAYLMTDPSVEKITASFSSFDPASSTAILNVHYEGLVTYKIDTGSIPGRIRGENATQVQNLLLTNPNIVGVDIEFKPFWVKTVPRFSNKINITVSQKPSS